jgi:hypothetical protein
MAPDHRHFAPAHADSPGTICEGCCRNQPNWRPWRNLETWEPDAPARATTSLSQTRSSSRVCAASAPLIYERCNDSRAPRCGRFVERAQNASSSSSSASGRIVRLRHGTTRMRAEHILQNGPDPTSVVGGDTAYGFPTAPEHGPYPLGDPEDYARRKARLFPHEGGPVILEMDVPESIVALAVHPGDEVWFGPGFGLEDLLTAWPGISKKVVIP